jgi:glucose dehydrogenase
VKIDPKDEFKPFYSQYRGKDLGVTQWPRDAWKIGGGTVWGWISYDPEQDLIFHGTSNPAPWNHLQRPGDNHWTNGVLRANPRPGWLTGSTPTARMTFGTIPASMRISSWTCPGRAVPAR